MRLVSMLLLWGSGCAGLIIPANWRYEPPRSLIARASDDFGCDAPMIKVERIEAFRLLASGCARQAVFVRTCKFESGRCWKLDQALTPGVTNQDSVSSQ